MSTDRCIDIDGARVHVHGEVDDMTRDALATVVAAAREQFGEPTPEQTAKYEAGQARLRALRERHATHARSDAEKKRISDAEDRINPCRS